MEQWWSGTDRGTPKCRREIYFSATCALQALQGLAWDRNWASAMTGQRLTA